jgi:hypothetical protein
MKINSFVIIMITILIVISCCKSKAQESSKQAFQEQIRFLENNAQMPPIYVCNKLKSHDIVVIGETHQKAEYCQLICDVLWECKPDYYASEFIKCKHTERANRIVKAYEFNREKAIQLYRDYAWPVWGFEEYLEIIHVIWEINSMENDSSKFIKIIGMDSDWSQYENMCGKERGRMEKYQETLDREKNLFESVSAKYEKGKKIIAHVGFAHTLYKFPPRFAAELYKKYDDEVFQICLHHQMAGNPEKMTLINNLESIMKANENKPVGFDIIGSPFAAMKDDKCFYFQPKQHESLKDIAMGYIFMKPVDELSRVSWIDGFVNDENFEAAKCVARKMKWVDGEVKNCQELNQELSKYFSNQE